MCFDQYLKENVFDVCGMKSTGYYELDKLLPPCANYYIYCTDTDDYRTNIFSVNAKGMGRRGACPGKGYGSFLDALSRRRRNLKVTCIEDA